MRSAYALFSIAFMAWAFGFGYFAVADFFHAALAPNVGVGTAAVVMMTELMWIGGCMALGVAALIFKPTSLPDAAAVVPSQPRTERSTDWPADQSTPRAGEHTSAAATGRSSHAGREYLTYADGRVLAFISNKTMTWQSEAGFKAWAERAWDEGHLSRGTARPASTRG